MRPCLVGIGGAGGNVLKQFLRSYDADLIRINFGEHLAFGGVRGLWLESASQDAQDQGFYGSLANGEYPSYLICHDSISPDSKTRDYVMNTYGFDLKAQGYDRRAEYLKAIFEIFDSDKNLRSLASDEFNGEVNPLPGYIWREGIRPFTTICVSKACLSDLDGPDLEKPGGLQSSISSLLNKNNRDSDQDQSKLCDSIIFIASLGGGTGTGFINPITSYVRMEELAFPIFALGILTEKGSDSRHAMEGQRDLGAVVATYDLLTKVPGTGIDALIIIDNNILLEKYGGNYSAMDARIFSAMRPLVDRRNYPGAELQDDAPAMRRVIWETNVGNEVDGDIGLLPPILVPCYHQQKISSGSEDVLVERALMKPDRLFDCDPTKADRVFVFVRGFVQADKITEAVCDRTKIPPQNIKVYRKIGDKRTEDILIMLRNPYGGSSGAHEIEGTLEMRFHGIISEAIRYIDNNKTDIIDYLGYSDNTKTYLKNYFYGDDGMRDELYASLDRLEAGSKPFFYRPISIFGGKSEPSLEYVSREAAEAIEIGEREKIEALIRAEFRKMLTSEECREKIRAIMKD
ncbi:MAG: hypothetical protein LUQ47_00730 [Methanotrichaceae archaeon]|nr:hypothetical protein [Methanotrichaceae archaeon]